MIHKYSLPFVLGYPCKPRHLVKSDSSETSHFGDFALEVRFQPVQSVEGGYQLNLRHFELLKECQKFKGMSTGGVSK